MNVLEYIDMYFEKNVIIENNLNRYLSDELYYDYNKEFFIFYKYFVLIIKTCLKLNLKGENLKEIDNSYKVMKKTFTN